LVGFVVALALAALIGFSLWLTANSRSSGQAYDILLDQSVSGLLEGSPVTFSGVPVGRIMKVELDSAQAGRVRVRIDISKGELTIPEGTVARLEGNLLFGTALISLEPPKQRAGPLLARAGEEVPVIPVAQSGLDSFVNDPTPMIESIAFATDRLMEATTPEEQERLSAKLEAMERMTNDLAAEAPRLGDRIAPARASIQESAAASAAMARQAAEARRGLSGNGSARIREMRASMAGARESTRALDARLQATRPAVQGLSASVAAAGKQIGGAREGVAAATGAIQQVERGGAGSLVSGPPTPDYKPNER
jgi:phospholipid/cholesterol/gamma-HCH transport system substrate-binding protein